MDLNAWLVIIPYHKLLILLCICPRHGIELLSENMTQNMSFNMTMLTDLFLFFSISQRISGQSQGRIPEQMGPSWSSKQNFIDITEC